VPTTVVLADDHPLMLRALNNLFESEAEFSVIAQCADGEEALTRIRALHPDVVILDIRMPRRDGLSVARELRRTNLWTKVVLLTASLDDREMLEATSLGVSGVVLKEMAPHLLLQCVRKVCAGERWLERRAATRAFETLLRNETASRELERHLTPREIQIVRLVAEGRRNKAIADSVSISEATVKTHLHNIYEKLGVESRAELIIYCRKLGLI
jgi:DNA-binding NarL/FixJ family response regulator